VVEGGIEAGIEGRIKGRIEGGNNFCFYISVYLKQIRKNLENESERSITGKIRGR
jgi:hypothetical protein